MASDTFVTTMPAQPARRDAARWRRVFAAAVSGSDAAGIDRVVVAVKRALAAARRLGVEQLYIFTTAAVRDATNRDLVLARVEREVGVRPQCLSGADEVRLQ
jgi:Ppx/GppA phosphatase family protein